MALRFYITPSIGSGASTDDARRPKYIADLPRNLAGQMLGAWYDYGWQPIFLCGVDLTAEEDALVTANSDVFAFPFDLDTVPNAGARNSAIAAFEAALIPGNNWVVAGITWRGIARTIAGMFRFMQRLDEAVVNRTGGHIALIDDSSKLNVQFGSLPTENQQDILQAAASFGYDTTFIQSNTQLRAILKNLADQWGNETFFFSPFTL